MSADRSGFVTTDRETLANARLWLAFASMLFVSGITNVFPVFFPALLAEFGGSRGVTAFTVSLCWLGGAVLGPVAGFLVARANPRGVAIVGLTAAAVGMLLGTAAPSLPLFVAAVGIGCGIGVGLTGIATQASLLADVCHRRRGVAMGIAFSGSMAAYAIAPLVHRAIEQAGWRAALGAYGAAVCALIPLAWRILPTRLESAPARGTRDGGAAGPSVAEIVTSPPFGMLFLAFTTPPLFGYLATTQHALYFTARGLTAEEASLMLAAGGVLSAGGRMLAGVAADRLGAPATGFLSFGLSLTGMLCLFAFEAWAPASPRLRLRAVPVPAAGQPGHDLLRPREPDHAARALRAHLRDPRDRQQSGGGGGRGCRVRSTTGRAPTWSSTYGRRASAFSVSPLWPASS
jgi:predicted MFS family arabinose efflux permease